MREDSAVVDRLTRQGVRPVDYEDGLAVARRIRASRYLGELVSVMMKAPEPTAFHVRMLG